MDIHDKALEAAVTLVMRANDLDDIKFLTDKDAALVRDLKAAVSDVFAAVADIYNRTESEAVA